MVERCESKSQSQATSRLADIFKYRAMTSRNVVLMVHHLGKLGVFLIVIVE